MTGILERIAYAITRGAIKAIWEELRKPRTAVDEELTDEDAEQQERIRARLIASLGGVPSNGDGDSGPKRSAPDKSADQGPSLGTPT